MSTKKKTPWVLYVSAFMMFAVILGPIAIAAFTAKPKRVSTATPARTPVPVAPSQTETIEDMMAWQQSHDQFLARIVKAAEQAAKGDAYAENLVKEFREGVRPARVQPGGSYRIMLGGSMPETIPFPIVIVDKNEERFLDHKPRAAFTFTHDAFIFLADQPWQDWYLGVVALHEMVHWDDLASGREAPRARGEEWTRGEVRAHEAENAALDRLSGGKFLKVVREVAADPVRCVRKVGDPICLITDTIVQTRLHDVWPDKPLSPEEWSNRGGSLAVAIALVQAKDEKAKVVAYDWVIRMQADTRL